MFGWFRERLARWAAERRGRQHYSAAEGSDVERFAIVGLMMAIETEDVVAERQKLTQANQTIFMLGYECCMMWAIKSGAEKVLKPEQVTSLVLAMKRHLAKHAWYQAEAIEKIWNRVEVMMPMAMNMNYGPDAPPPYPPAELHIALDQAGYPLDKKAGVNVKFGMCMLLMMVELSKRIQSIARQGENAGRSSQPIQLHGRV
jgi:hypothetical protein